MHLLFRKANSTGRIIRNSTENLVANIIRPYINQWCNCICNIVYSSGYCTFKKIQYCSREGSKEDSNFCCYLHAGKCKRAGQIDPLCSGYL